MNSIALILWTVVAFGQISAGQSPPGLKAGWKTEADGYMSYIAQVPPDIAMKMATEGREMALDIPDFLQGRVNRIVWRIGLEDVEREPSEAELRTLPREIFPRSGVNAAGPGGLSSLSDHTTGNTVMIDSPRPGTMMLPAAGANRVADDDPTLPPVPSLAQTYTSPSARASQANQFDMPRSGVGSSVGNGLGTLGQGLGIAPVLPRQDTLPANNSKPFFGPPLPPTSTYTGGQVTVTGSSNGSTAQNTWNDSRNPIASGTFGNSNNYGASSAPQYYPPAPPPAPAWNNGAYSPPGTNYAGTTYPGMVPSPNTGVMPPQYMASAAQVPPIGSRTMVDGTKRTTSYRDEIPYENVPATPPSYVVALLLASLVGNAYLVMLLNNLLQRYRTLQASSRGSTSLAI